MLFPYCYISDLYAKIMLNLDLSTYVPGHWRTDPRRIRLRIRVSVLWISSDSACHFQFWSDCAWYSQRQSRSLAEIFHRLYVSCERVLRKDRRTERGDSAVLWGDGVLSGVQAVQPFPPWKRSCRSQEHSADAWRDSPLARSGHVLSFVNWPVCRVRRWRISREKSLSPACTPWA